MKFVSFILIVLHTWSQARATDAWDSQLTRQNINLDLSAVYAWVADEKLKIVVTVGTQKPPTKFEAYAFFSPRGRYVIHVDTDEDLRPDFDYEFFVSAKGEVLLKAYSQEWRATLNDSIQSEGTLAMAGISKSPEFGDSHSLKQWIMSSRRCTPTAASDLRCFPSSKTEPTDDYADMVTGFLSMEIPLSSLSTARSTGRYNVWATTGNKI